MQRVAMAAQRADDQPAALDGLLERLQLRRILQERSRLAVRVAGIRAAADLHGADAERLEVVERLLEGLAAEQDREHADLHRLLIPVSVATKARRHEAER